MKNWINTLSATIWKTPEKSRLTFLVLVLIVTGCKKDGDDPSLHLDYQPVNLGWYVEYDVTEIIHDDALNQHDTIHYYLKEYIESEFLDNEDRPGIRIERSRKDSLDGTYAITDIWYGVRNVFRYEKIEEDERIIRLAFPVREGLVWDGNALNNNDAWECAIEYVHQPGMINGFSFDSTALVIERDFKPGFYFHEESAAIYAKGVGQVYRREKLLQINVADTLDVLKGTERYMHVIGYGYE